MSNADELRKLNELVNEGLITEEEFNKQKKKLLNSGEHLGGGNKKYYLLIVVLIILFGNIWGDDDTDNSNPNSSSVSENRCSRVSQSFLNELAGNDGFDLRNGYVVNSADFQDGWSFVSAEAYNSGGLGIDGKILSWFVDQYPSSNYIEGVGAFGEEYSSWGASINNKKGSPYDDGYSESRDCVK